jgi:hypothetical protein
MKIYQLIKKNNSKIYAEVEVQKVIGFAIGFDKMDSKNSIKYLMHLAIPFAIISFIKKKYK